jgi:hypothetical protein
MEDSILENKSMAESHKFSSGSEVKGLMINHKMIDLVVSPESLLGRNSVEQPRDMTSPMQVIYKSEIIEKE